MHKQKVRCKVLCSLESPPRLQIESPKISLVSSGWPSRVFWIRSVRVSCVSLVKM